MSRKRDSGGGSSESGGGDLPPCTRDDSAPGSQQSPSWVAPSRGGSTGGYQAATRDELCRKLPVLADFLLLTGVGGRARKTGTVLIFAEDAKWKACVNDRDGGYYAFHSAEGLESLLEALDGALKGGKLDWRESKGKR